MAENTIVSLYGDHGYHLGEQGLWGKTTNFELDTRVPLIVRVPGLKTNGQSTRSLVELVDLYPTLSELAGLPLIDLLEGRSCVPILNDPTTETKDFALSQYPRGGGLMGYSMRDSTHRLTQWVHRETGEVRATELYEYGDSKIEMNNLAEDEQHAPRRKKMSQQLFRSFGLNRQPGSTPGNSSAPLSIARVFGDRMVLQAGQPIRVWGKAKSGASVSVSMGSSATSITADSSGKWHAELPQQKRSTSPKSLVAKSGDATVEISDVLIGEVWFCAGQSNMEWPLSKTDNAKQALAESDDTQLRLLNFVGAARGGSGVYTEKHFPRMSADRFCQGTWEVSDSNSARDFSAVGFYFAKQLRSELDCPIGMINVSIGGTPIEAWVSKAELGSHPQLSQMVSGNWLDNPVLDDWCKLRARSNLKRGLSGELNMPGDETGPNHSFKPGFMFAAGVAPFLPMSIKGVLWYQGESNADNRNRIEQYDHAFPVLVNSWRSGFENPNMPVAFVQLPAMGRPNWPIFREYQRRSLGKLQNVGMAITMDTGHPTNVHPPDKRPVGERLAVWALTNTYGRSGPATGPLYQSKSIDANAIVITFIEVGDGLETTDGGAPRHFEIAGADKKFHPANAKIDGNRIKLTSDLIKSPLHARYAWAPYPKPTVNLINSAGLPASPFTTEEEF